MYKSGIKENWIYRVGLVCFFLLVLLLPDKGVAAYNAHLVLSSSTTPYRQAADALEKILAEQAVVIQSFTLEELIDSVPVVPPDNDKEVWVAIGGQAAVYLHSFLPETVPLIYCMVADPESLGLKGGRDTVAGISVATPVEDQFVLIQKALPDLASIGMFYRASSAKSVQSLADVQDHLPPAWQLVAVDLDGFDSMAEAMQKLFQQDVDMIWTMDDSSIYNWATIKALLLASLRNKTPVFGFSGSCVKAGALLGLEVSPKLQGQYAASLVLDAFSSEKKLLTSGEPNVTFAVNMVVARRLGISLPDKLVGSAVLIGADQ